ncbi:unnamed protein product [Amoebophrya sp. A25]|nr:unnamed protein product [Amoebophrya sp. A25]|eukprot:GSA25T00006409001.1
MMHEIKFHNPRKLWVFTRRPNADIWLDIMKLVDHDCVNHRAHRRNDHFYNGHLLDIQGVSVPKQNHSRRLHEEALRSKVFDRDRSDALFQNQAGMQLLGGVHIGSKEGDEREIDGLLTIPAEPQNMIQVSDIVEKPLAMCKSLRPNDQYPSTEAVKEGKLVLGPLQAPRPLTEVEAVARRNTDLVNETMLFYGDEGGGGSSSSTANLFSTSGSRATLGGGAGLGGGSGVTRGGLKGSQSAMTLNDLPVRVSLGGSKRTFRRAMAKTERISNNRQQLQNVLLQTAAMTGHYDQTLSTWRQERAAIGGGSIGALLLGESAASTLNRPTSSQGSNAPDAGSTAGADVAGGATGAVVEGQHYTSPNRGGASSSEEQMAYAENHQDQAVADSATGEEPSGAAPVGGAAISPSTRGSAGGDNIDPSVRQQIYGPLLNTNDAICKAADKIPLVCAGDSIPVIGAGGVRLLRPNQYSISQNFSDAYKSSILTTKKKAIVFGTCAIDKAEREEQAGGSSSSTSAGHHLGGGGSIGGQHLNASASAGSVLLRKNAYSTLNPNSIMPSIKQLYGTTWYNTLPCKGDSKVTQIGAMPVIIASGVDAETKIRPVVWNNKEFGHIDVAPGATNNHVETTFSNVRYPYNNHGLFYHNVNNKTSNTISSTHLELNARMLTQKQTKSTLSLDREELYRYVATDQGPLTGAVNHADLGAHIDHAKYIPRGQDYAKTAKIPVASRFQSQFLARNKEMCPTPQDSKNGACPGTRDVSGPFRPWKQHCFRADEPERNGRFGPRIFNAENLGERPLDFPISGIESRPNPDHITNFLNIEKMDSGDANVNIAVVRPEMSSNVGKASSNFR